MPARTEKAPTTASTASVRAACFSQPTSSLPPAGLTHRGDVGTDPIHVSGPPRGRRKKEQRATEKEYEKYGAATQEEYEAAREAEDNARGLFWVEVPGPWPGGIGWTLRKLTRQEAATKRRREYSATQQQQAKAQQAKSLQPKAAGGALARTRSGALGTAAARKVRDEAAVFGDVRAAQELGVQPEPEPELAGDEGAGLGRVSSGTLGTAAARQVMARKKKAGMKKDGTRSRGRKPE